VLQRVAVYCNVLQRVAACFCVDLIKEEVEDMVCCSVLQCIAMYCSVLQRVAV